MIRHPIRALYDNLPQKAARPAVTDGERRLSHAELVAAVERRAADLMARGIKAGDRIGLCAHNSIDHVCAYLAILRAGAVWVPLNPRNGLSLNQQFQARAKLVLTLHDRSSTQQVDLSGPSLGLDDWQATGAAALPDIEDDPDAVFAIKFTGGSTGIPKGVVQSVRSGAAALASLRAFYRFGADDLNLAVAPLTHGASHYILPVLAAGGCHHLLSKPDRADILQALKAGVTCAFMPPTLIYLLMEEAAFKPSDLPGLRHLTYSAAPMPPPRIAQAITRFGPVLSTLYGQTEAPMAIAGLSPADMQDEALRASVGKVFSGIDIAFLGDDGVIQSQTGQGEILVRGDLCATVYLDDPEQTAAARIDGWLRTGDVGRRGADGHLYLLGRAKEMIISGGYNIYPAEVEAALCAHPAVKEACAFGLEDGLWGERLEAVVALRKEADTATLCDFVRHRLGAVRTPKVIHIVPALPRNPVGKVVRGEVLTMIQTAIQ
ncbi:MULTISPECIES: class I adenylate-forming enzyme family protein [unclassified Brevundimonas]|uniref:class I adenylate-forming enzyme family protein n=1 Tax=unclassified Brevundimonas TaxID=2622653 RepID=UPI0025C01931|nr:MULTISPECIES: AMP-binding protein [unclassified Brevundimonas]